MDAAGGGRHGMGRQPLPLASHTVAGGLIIHTSSRSGDILVSQPDTHTAPRVRFRPAASVLYGRARLKASAPPRGNDGDSAAAAVRAARNDA